MLFAWLSVILLGIIEGITEFLPISSTGHMLIAERWLQPQSDLFIVVIQSGAVLAVLPLFPERLRQFVFRWRAPETKDYLAKILVAFAITGVGGLALEKLNFKLEEDLLPIALAVLIGGVLFIAVERWLERRPLRNDITWSIVIAVGVGQLLAAVFPGTSRSGSTILMALILGLNRVAATEFTFLVGIPTMLAAGGLKIVKALHEGADENWGMLLVGFAVASAVSFLVVKWLLRYVQTHTFAAFGWYRVGLALILFGILLNDRRPLQPPPPGEPATPTAVSKTQAPANPMAAPAPNGRVRYRAGAFSKAHPTSFTVPFFAPVQRPETVTACPT